MRTHGKNSTYTNGKCRCLECKAAHAAVASTQQAKATARLRRRRILAALQAYKLEAGCADCGYRDHPEALQFDHVRGEKKFNIARAVHLSMAAIVEEAVKCEVVCANCHAVRTASRRPNRAQTSTVIECGCTHHGCAHESRNP